MRRAMIVALIGIGATVSGCGPSAQERRACEIYTKAEVENLVRANLNWAVLLPAFDETAVVAHEFGLPPDRVRQIVGAQWCLDIRRQAKTDWWLQNKAQVDIDREKREAERAAERAALDKALAGAKRAEADAKWAAERATSDSAARLEEMKQRLESARVEREKAVADSKKRADEMIERWKR